MRPLAIVPLFAVTALAEIGGCYLFLWLRDSKSAWLLAGAAVLLGAFAWLLSFHPNAGRAYAAYGGIYVASAVAWGWLVEKKTPDRWDILGALVVHRRGDHHLAGAAAVMLLRIPLGGNGSRVRCSHRKTDECSLLIEAGVDCYERRRSPKNWERHA